MRYSTPVNEGITLRLREGKGIKINFEYAGVARHSDRHQIEFSMVTLVRICRELTNRHVRPSRVSFTHRRKDNSSELKTFFGSDVKFEQRFGTSYSCVGPGPLAACHQLEPRSGER